MLNFDANPITIGYLVTVKEFVNAKNSIKQRNLNIHFCQYLKIIITDIRA